MRVMDLNAIVSLQRKSTHVRNICIVAHVDHGKTTLADSLVASNGIISTKMAGKLRYMDSRKDEQLRGITMKSSAISIIHSWLDEQYLINLIDSPGHVDFSHEVSTGVRLCDGAILVVDVVEGVCAQTKLALLQAWQENIKPVLVLNKIDRLILELKLTPLDAYVKLTQVLEQVNAIMGELFAADVLTKSEKIERPESTEASSTKSTVKDTSDWSDGLEEADDEHLYFSPERGNVAFASAFDGWAFRIKNFAKLYSTRLGVSERVLERTLWGDYYLNSKAKRISKGAQMKAKKPLFVQLVLENLWALYDVVAVRRDKDKLEKILQTLDVKITARDMRHTDPKVQLHAVCSNWLPLADAVLGMVCGQLPAPKDITKEKAESLMCANVEHFPLLPAQTQSLRNAFLSCDPSESAPVIVYISKMCPVDRTLLPENKQKPLTPEEMAERRRIALEKHAARLTAASEGEITGQDEGEKGNAEEEKVENDEPVEDAFVAFARIFSGTIKEGQELFVLGPKHDPALALKKNFDEIASSKTILELNATEHITRVRIPSLFLFMGRDIIQVPEVPAGNVLGIGGLQDYVLKTATISNTVSCPSFTEMRELVTPILRVAVEPRLTQHMPQLVRGLKLLNQADPAVEVRIQESGEHVVLTVGEVHLQRCLEDLKERYARVPINVSEPIVPFRETIVVPPKIDMVNEVIEGQNSVQTTESSDKGTVEMVTPNKQCKIILRAVPLPNEVTLILENNVEIIRSMETRNDISENISKLSLEENEKSVLTERSLKATIKFKSELQKAFLDAGEQWSEAFEKIWCFGPRRYGPNILFNYISNHDRSFWKNSSANAKCGLLSQYDSSFTSGFQLATLAGPLCEEPMMGVGFIIEDWQFLEESSVQGMAYGPLSGQILSCVKEGCRKAFQAQPQRLMMAMYSCSILVNADVLGKMYAVLGRRHGRVLHGDMTQSSATFAVNAVLPVVESFSFAQEMRKQTSGLASPQLLFSHWEVLDVDPFWTPRTEEEYLHFGEKADSENRARRYIDAVRRRKGLPVEEKLVEFAEKQRTLSKKK